MCVALGTEPRGRSAPEPHPMPFAVFRDKFSQAASWPRTRQPPASAFQDAGVLGVRCGARLGQIQGQSCDGAGVHQ